MKKRRKRRCIWCSALFVESPRLKGRQKACGSKFCKRRQNLLAQRWWKKKNKEVCRQNQKDWQTNHQGYWKGWRKRHPAYVVRNRHQSRIRKSLSKLGLQRKLDILQVSEKQVKFWYFHRFAKQTRSLSPLLFAYRGRHERAQGYQEHGGP